MVEGVPPLELVDLPAAVVVDEGEELENRGLELSMAGARGEERPNGQGEERDAVGERGQEGAAVRERREESQRGPARAAEPHRLTAAEPTTPRIEALRPCWTGAGGLGRWWGCRRAGACVGGGMGRRWGMSGG